LTSGYEKTGWLIKSHPVFLHKIKPRKLVIFLSGMYKYKVPCIKTTCARETVEHRLLFD